MLVAASLCMLFALSAAMPARAQSSSVMQELDRQQERLLPQLRDRQHRSDDDRADQRLLERRDDLRRDTLREDDRRRQAREDERRARDRP